MKFTGVPVREINGICGLDYVYLGKSGYLVGLYDTNDKNLVWDKLRKVLGCSVVIRNSIWTYNFPEEVAYD